MPNLGRKKGKKKKFQGRNNGPSRQRYWQYESLKDHKVKALMERNGMTHAAAVVFWRNARKGRIKA